MAVVTQANETNGLLDGHDYHASVKYSAEMTLAQFAALKGTITRVRVLSDHGRYDISYIHGQVVNEAGEVITVPIIVDCTGSWMQHLKADLIDWAKREGVYAKGIGLLDENNWSVLR